MEITKVKELKMHWELKLDTLKMNLFVNENTMNKNQRFEARKKISKAIILIKILSTVNGNKMLDSGIQLNNIGDIIECVLTYKYTGEFKKSPKNEFDITLLNGHKIEVKSLIGDDAPTYSIHDKSSYALIFIDTRLYKLAHKEWIQFKKENGYQKKSEIKKNIYRLFNNYHSKKFIIDNGTLQKDYSKL